MQILAVMELKGGLVMFQNCFSVTEKKGSNSIIKNDIRNDVE